MEHSVGHDNVQYIQNMTAYEHHSAPVKVYMYCRPTPHSQWVRWGHTWVSRAPPAECCVYTSGGHEMYTQVTPHGNISTQTILGWYSLSHKHLIIRYHKILELWEWVSAWSCCSDIWQVPRQHSCRVTCQISESSNNGKLISLTQHYDICTQTILCRYSLSCKMNYWQILWRLEDLGYGFKIIRSLWYLIGLWAAMLPTS